MAEEEIKEDETNKEEPKGSKKLLIVGLLAGLLVGGGGAAGFFIMQSGSEGQNEKLEEVVVEEKAPELPDYQYVHMNRFNLPVFYKGRVLNYTVMDVSLETIGNEDMVYVGKKMLIIRDILLRYYSVNSVGRVDNPRIVDFNKLSTKIKDVANNEIGKEMVTRVVINESRSF